MNEKTCVHSAPEREAPSPAITPNPLGLPEAELPMIVLDKVRSEPYRRRKDAKRLQDEQRTQSAHAHRLERRKAGSGQNSTKGGRSLDGGALIQPRSANLPPSWAEALSAKRY